jgi:hypothetical protein
MEDSVSLRSRVEFSRQFELDGLPTESELDRGGGDVDLEGGSGDDEVLRASMDCSGSESWVAVLKSELSLGSQGAEGYVSAIVTLYAARKIPGQLLKQ